MGAVSASRLWLDALHLSGAQLAARVRAAAGTMAAQASAVDGPSFEQGARVARPPWREVDVDALCSLGVRTGRAQFHDTLAVVPVSPVLVERFRSLRRRLCDPSEHATAAGEITDAVAQLGRELRETAQWTLERTVPFGNPFSAAAGGRQNTTVNSRTDKHVGLHFDSWDRLAPRERQRGTNRICLNLGAGRRSLQFVPLPAVTVVDLLRQRGVDVVHNDDALRDCTGRMDLARRFLEICPDAPVLRVAIEPGEAYVAPTENIIHDGSVDTSSQDLTVTIRGYLHPL
jgi:hypothetical protein